MFILRHKLGQWISKGILTVICLSLLTAQASHKFYQFASVHPVRTPAVLIITGQALAGNSDDLRKDASGPEFRSLDKRFDITHFFIVPAPFPGMSSLVGERRLTILYFLPNLVHRTKYPALLRGPPHLS